MIQFSYNRRGVEVMEIRFHIADSSKVEGIVKLCNKCFDEETSVEKALEVFNQTKKDKNQIYLIGECNGEIIAHTRITIIETIFSGMENYAIINHVCVDPEYRKHHVATEMLKIIKKICLERRCISIKLWSKNFRVPAHTCYKRFGFQPIDATFFELELGGNHENN